MADDEGSDEERADENGAEPPGRYAPDADDGSEDDAADAGDDADESESPCDGSDERPDAEGDDVADAADAGDDEGDVYDPYGFDSYDPFSLDADDAEDADDASEDDGERDRPHVVSNFERRRAEREAAESSADDADDGEEADADDGEEADADDGAEDGSGGDGDDDGTEESDDDGADETDGGDGEGEDADGDEDDEGPDSMYHDPEFDPEYADAAATESIGTRNDGDGGGGVLDAPEGDEELPLAVHIEEMVRRLFVVLAVVGLVTLVVFPVADQLINYLWNYHIPGAPELADRRPRLYGPLELILTEIKVASLAGVVIGLPVFVYETYRFMRPGLYPRERRYYLASVPTSLVLALIGLAFAHFVVLPAIFAYFTAYTTGTAVVAFGLQETFRLILLLMGYMAVVFQIPLFIMLAIMMNLVTREGLESRRLLFWGAFLGISFFVSPDPTGMAPIIIAATMVVLFEGTLLLLRWTGN